MEAGLLISILVLLGMLVLLFVGVAEEEYVEERIDLC